MSVDRVVELLSAARHRSNVLAREAEVAATGSRVRAAQSSRSAGGSERREGAVVQAVSDVHFQQGFPAQYRVLGELVDAEDVAPLQSGELRAFLEMALRKDQLADFDRVGDPAADAAFSHERFGRIRIRATIGNDSNGIVVAIRLLPSEAPEFDELYLPTNLLDWLAYPTGLILIVGANGSGKTTALASLIKRELERMLAGYRRRVYTFEDPIEYLFHHRAITQYERGRHFSDVGEALRGMRRGNPDIVVMQELGTRADLDVAFRLSEQSNLVIGTLHAPSVYRVHDRILAEYPPDNHSLVRTLLASQTRGFMKMELIKTTSGRSQRAVCELLTPTAAIRSIIEKGNGDLRNAALSAGVQTGNVPFETAVKRLVDQEVITQEAARRHTLLSGLAS